MDTKNIIIGVLAIVTIALGGYAINQPTQIVVQIPQLLGASAGTEHGNMEHFAQGITMSGGYSLGSAATTSITAAQVCQNSSLLRNPATVTTTTTLPTALALGQDCLPNTGDSKEIILVNTSVTAASSTVFAAADASTTIRLVSSATATSTATVAGLNIAKLTFVKTAASTMTVLISTYLSP